MRMALVVDDLLHLRMDEALLMKTGTVQSFEGFQWYNPNLAEQRCIVSLRFGQDLDKRADIEQVYRLGGSLEPLLSLTGVPGP